MALLPEVIPPTVMAIYDHYERKAADWRRAHLGASVVGRSCLRHVWYLFRWASKPERSGRMEALLARGSSEELRLVKDLRAIGTPVVNRQAKITFGPHTGGSIDGELVGMIEASATAHLFECKTANVKNFARIKKEGVEKAKPEHYAQMQVYMHARNLARAAYFVVCKDTDEIYLERIPYDARAALALVAKAELVVKASEPLSRISESPTWYECVYCDHRSHCQLGEIGKLARNCRTCLSSTPMPDGTWRCDLKNKTLSVAAQKKGCKEHRFIPKMLTGYDAHSAEGRDVMYYSDSGHALTDRGQVL